MPMIEIPVDGQQVEAYLALPDTGTPAPGVLLFIDAFGLRPRIEDMADRIASGLSREYVVLAPNLFHRDGRVADLAPTEDLRAPGARERAFAAMGSRITDLTTERSLADTADYLAALRARPEVAAGPVGVVGYCMGARLATRAAGAHPDVVGAVGGFHGGGLATEAEDSPHRWVAASTAAYSYGHADEDPSMDPEAVARLGEALASTGRPYVNEVYAGARHGYTMADTSVYDEAACERHFAALDTLFATALPR